MDFKALLTSIIKSNSSTKVPAQVSNNFTRSYYLLPLLSISWLQNLVIIVKILRSYYVDFLRKGYWILTATSYPVLRVALCTWAKDAAAIAEWSNV